MKKRMVFITFVLLTFCLSLNVFAENVKIGATVEVNSGWVYIKNIIFPVLDGPLNFWLTSGKATLKAETMAKSSVKAFIDASYQVNSAIPNFPETDNNVFSLNKMYVKAKLPWLNGKSARLSIGKQPLSYGFGLYYNAGDIIFGANPSSQDLASGTSLSTSSLSSLRALTDWMFIYNMPIFNILTLEAIALPPINTTLNGKYGRFGGRAIIRTDFVPLENIELSYITEGDLLLQKAALSLDGSIFFDYNLCSCIGFSTDSFLKDQWAISLSLNKIFSIQTDVSVHSLNIRAEGLYYPETSSAGVFGFISYAVTDNVSISANYMWQGDPGIKYTENNHYAGISAEWELIKQFSFSLQGLLQCDKPDNMCTIIAGVKYSY